MIYWEQRKLGEIADKVVEKNFQLQERDVFTNSAEFGIIDQKDFFDHEIVNKNNIGGYYIVSPNDFVYNPRISVTAPVGPINRNKLCKRGIMSPLYTVFHPRNMNETFLEFFFKTNKWHKFMEYNGDSGARSDRFSIKTELFYVMTIPFPSHEEQSKVGICLESLDYLITLHQSKAFGHILEAIVSCILSWEQRKLGEIAEYKKGPFGSALRKDIFVQKGKDTVKIYEQQNAICKDWKLERYFVTKEYANKLTGFEVQGGDIIVSCAGTIGEIYEIPYDAEIGIINQALMRIKVYQMVIDKGIFIILFSNLIDKFSIVHSNGSAIKNIPAFSDLKPTIVFVPSIVEQKKIGKCFKTLDHLITLHQLEPFQLIFKAIAYRIIDYAKSKSLNSIKQIDLISYIKCYV